MYVIQVSDNKADPLSTSVGTTMFAWVQVFPVLLPCLLYNWWFSVYGQMMGVSDSVRDGYAEVGAVPELELVVGVRSNN